MATIEARCLDGSSVKVSKVTSVSDIMFYFAKMRKRLASDVVVICPKSGKNLCNSPSQNSPPVVEVAFKQEEKRSIEDLLLTLRIHCKCEDEETCKSVYSLLRTEYDKSEISSFGEMSLYRRILDDVLEEGACGDPKTEEKILRTLFRVGVNANYFLQEAAGNGNEGRVRMLLTNGVSIECSNHSGDRIVCAIPALSTAAWNGRANVVEILLAHKAHVNRPAHVHEMPSDPLCYKPSNVGSPLIFACYNGDVDVVKMLIEQKARIDQQSSVTWPLRAACSEKHIDVAKILLSYGADVNYTFRFSKYDNPIMLAARHGFVDVAKLLVSYKAKLQFFDYHYNTPVMIAVCVDRDPSHETVCGKVEVLKLLLAHKASANIGNPRTGDTALIIALRDGKMKNAIKVLLDHKADVNICSADGLHPLQLASQNGDAVAVNLLQAQKADLNLKNLNTAIPISLANDHKVKAKNNLETAMHTSEENHHLFLEDLKRLLYEADIALHSQRANERPNL